MIRPQPTDQETTFKLNEMFFSTTDRRGIILDGNEVFVNISKYSRDEIFGAPHNIVRHPDMPKIIFQTLWDSILSGKVICAYVKNLVKDGSFYWVFATVVPLGENFLSIRMKPTTDNKNTIENFYRELIVSEKTLGKDATAKLFTDVINSLGFSDYNAFSAAALSAELESRYNLQSLDLQNNNNNNNHKTMMYGTEQLYFINRSFFKIFTLMKKNSNYEKSISEKMLKIAEISKNIELSALNTIIEAERIGDEGKALSVLAEQIAKVSGEAKEINAKVSFLSSKILEGFRASEFSIALSTIQIEMLSSFVSQRKTTSLESGEDSFNKNMNMLLTLVNESLTKAIPELNEINKISKQLASELENSIKILMTISFIQKTGSVESARLREGSAFYQLFVSIMNLINDAKLLFEDFSEVVNQIIRKNIIQAIKECNLLTESIANLKIEE